jgi:hypothetical protein
MGKDGEDNLAARYDSWKQLGCAPVVDCEKHHRRFGFTRWHQSRPPTQATWRQLIRLLLTYKGLSADTEAIRDYQRTKWGSATGETCVIELSGLAAPDMRTEQDRTTFLSRRTEQIREAALKHRPEFIVMYGGGHREVWERIAGSHFDSNGMCRMSKTVAASALHPAARGLGNDYWVKLGRLLRNTGECGYQTQ